MLKDRIYRSTKLMAALNVAADYGIGDEAVLRETDIEREHLNNSEHLISIHQLLIALQNLSRLRVDPMLPYEIGQTIHVSAYGMYGFAILCSMDFRKTMKFVQKYHALATPLARIEFSEEPGTEGWTIDPISHPFVDQEMRAFLSNMQIGIHISLHRDIMGPEFSPRRITVDYPRRMFYQLPIISGGGVVFSAKKTHIHFDGEWLDRRPTLGNEVTFQQFETLCRNELSSVASRAGIAGRVRTLFLQSLAAPMSIEKIANHMNISSRTLRRHLAAENTSYRAILDETRSEVAIRYIRDSNLTNDEAAFALGFADVSSFRRAFGRWTGKTTSDFRS